MRGFFSDPHFVTRTKDEVKSMSLFAPVILIILRVTCPSLHCLSRRPRSCVSTVQSMWGFSTPPWGEAEKTLGVNNMSIKVLQQLGANIRICGVAKLLTNWVSLWRRGSGWNLFYARTDVDLWSLQWQAYQSIVIKLLYCSVDRGAQQPQVTHLKIWIIHEDFFFFL